MSYDDFNSSADEGGPIQLYRFVYGSQAGEYIAYTSHTETINFDGIDYEPVPVDRGNVVGNGTLDKSAIQISFDIGTELAELFRIYPPSDVVLLTIYEGHIDDPDTEFMVVWSGRIVAANREGSYLRLSGEPIATQMKRPGLRSTYQYGCPLVLYGQELGLGGCGASKAAATVAATVASVAGNIITLNAGWNGAFAQDKFVRGQLEFTPSGESMQRRAIIRVSGNELTVSGIFHGLAASDGVDVVLGCNHRAFAEDGGDCEGLHDTLVTFGGYPWIPIKNLVNKNPYY